MDQDEFEYVARNICNKKNGFVTFTVSEQLLKNIIYDVSMYDLEEPPRNKMRLLSKNLVFRYDIRPLLL